MAKGKHSSKDLQINVRNEKAFAQAIQRFRKKKRLTQADIARTSGLTQSTVSKIELGLIEPTLGTAFKLLAALGLEVVIRQRSSAPDGWLEETI